MKPRAGVILIAAAALSSGAIISSALAGERPARADIRTLLKFETTFNEKMTRFLRTQSAQAGFASFRCMSDMFLERFYQVTVKINAPAAKANQCQIKTVEDGTKLRDAVVHYLDDVYAGKVDRKEVEGILKGKYDASWFIQRVGSIKAP